MSTSAILGFFAATCTTIAFLPQAIKTIKTRHTKDISFWMYLIFLTGLLSWLVYGIMINDPPLIIANAITSLLAAIILVLKIKFG